VSYRLRRVIGINIRNPRDEGPSLRIAELDTRGAVIAAGRNGVGKTSFLRLIPLFYGATPTRILRGSGLTTMMRYMLPHPSSAVAYEYERSSETDLRCVVMYCRPDEDAPQFHILQAPFEERFFCNDDNTFVLREDFKARVENLGIPVEQKLTLSEYRSVILNERATSKNAASLRNLAAAYSLAPSGATLQGLDQIAAAMGNEKISFRDLQDIVVERITSSISEDGGRHTVREIKKGARDVSSWLNDLQHLRDLRARHPQADELAKACATVQSLDSSLRELRSAVKAQLISTLEEKERLKRERSQTEVSLQLEAERLRSVMESAKSAREEAKSRHANASQVVQSTMDRKAHFQKIQIDALVADAELESSHLANQNRLGEELNKLRLAAQGVEDSHSEKLRQHTEAIAVEQARISQEREVAHLVEREELDLIDDAEEEALAKFVPSKRLEVLPEEISRNEVRLGEAQGEAKNPKASSKTLKELESTATMLGKAREAERLSRSAASAAAQAERTAFLERESALKVHARGEQLVAELKASILETEENVKPPAGSLQELLRQSSIDGAADIAKVLSPAIVKLTDLEPLENSVSVSLPAGMVPIGNLTLNVGRLETPEWFDLRDAQARLTSLRARLQQLEADAKKTEQQLRAANAAHKAAENASTMAASALESLHEESGRLEGRERGLRKERDTEIGHARARLQQLVTELEGKVSDLKAEKRRLEDEHRTAEKRLKTDFGQQRSAVKKRKSETLASLLAQEENLRKRDLHERATLMDSRNQELMMAGVDPKLVTGLESELSQVRQRLRAISDSRHEVGSWKEFARGTLARLELDREAERQAASDFANAKAEALGAENALDAHLTEGKQELARLDTAVRQKEMDELTLQELLDHQLAVIGEAAHGVIARSWALEELAADIGRKRSELTKAAAQVENLFQGLRSLMTRYEGQVYDWLMQAEATLPNFDGWPDHAVKRHKGLMIRDWFERDYVAAVNSLHQDLGGILSLASTFVRDIDLFERQVNSFNHGLQKALKSVRGFDNFRDLQVDVRSSVNKLEYIKTLQQMQQMNDARVSIFRGSSARLAREMELPGTEFDPVIRSFRDFLNREGGISVNLADQIRLECSLTINKSRVVISTEEEFKARASNGNSALIVAMFLMGFAQMVRKDCPVRITWVTDEIGRFDSGNVAAFLETLDNNHIDVISAAPQADPSMLDLFDRQCIFRKDGSIWEGDVPEVLHAH
jgi:Protein of unknown function (DUF3584)